MYLGSYALTQPDKLAAIRPATGETVSYRQLDARSNQLAQLFHAQGLRRGDHVALFLENHLAYFDVIWACMRSGLYLTPINRYLPAAEAAYIVDDCDAKALIASAALDASAELGRLATRCEIKLAVGGGIEGFADYEAALAAQPAERLATEWLGAFMLYSSGTTGRPKGILRPLPDASPEGGNPAMKFMGDLFGVDAATVYLTPAPLYHSAPVGFTAGVIQAGGTAVIMDRFDAETALQLIERYRVTHSQWVPAMFIRLLKLDPAVRTAHDLSSLTCAIHAAAPCPVDVKRQMIEWWGPILEEYYASTETAGLATIGSRDWLAHPGSVGRARGKPFHICNDAGDELPAGEPGLIYGEAPTGVRFAYHKDTEKTLGATHPTNPDWVTVGDVGYLDDDGYLYLTDRKAFMIISGGVNIYPQQIEDALALHPKVADVAVIGVPNAELGEEVKAVVEPAPGVAPSEALAQEIMEFVRAKLGRQLTPRSVDFVEQLPRLPTGKLYKKAVRDRYWGDSSPLTSLAARS
ncbi:acyl-CoA synthetase [Phenylobacterium sp. LjRoot219]|uniref:acyl-CoA synthetase n=1 Tax=Phenylobacterium sp. LjRoot219 TaxID=3342283 RepID=UPI003ECF0C36